MVLVNNPGTWSAVYRPLTHADWHGWTPTDLVFPFFLFIVGVSVPLALGRRRVAGASAGVLASRVVRRALMIFALGLVLNVVATLAFGGSLGTVRLLGVLQRIALCYLAAAFLFLGTGWRAQAAIGAALVLGYWALLTLVPVPGFGAGDLSKEGNLAAWLDRLLLGPHIWRGGKVYDPEGVLSTLPAIATTLAGVLAGHWLSSTRTVARRAGGLALAGAVALLVGLAWSVWFPINKSLWTSSYAVFTAGAAAVALAVCVWVIDGLGVRGWAGPFVVLGTNALALFFLSTLGAVLLAAIAVPHASGRITLHALLYGWGFASWATPINASLAWAIAYLLLWLGVLGFLYRQQIFIRV